LIFRKLDIKVKEDETTKDYKKHYEPFE